MTYQLSVAGGMGDRGSTLAGTIPAKCLVFDYTELNLNKQSLLRGGGHCLSEGLPSSLWGMLGPGGRHRGGQAEVFCCPFRFLV